MMDGFMIDILCHLDAIYGMGRGIL